MVGGLTSFVLIAGFIPPPAQGWGPQQVATFYADNEAAIRIGMEGVLVFASFLFVWSLALARIMRRSEGREHLLSTIQLIGGTATSIFTIGCSLLWLTATFVASVFAGEAANGMANVIALFAIGLVPFGVVFVLQRIFYALEDTRTPFFIQLAQSAVFTVGALIAGAGPVSQIANGIALSMSISTFIQAILMVIFIRRRLGHLGGKALGIAFVRFVIALIPAIGVGFIVREALPVASASIELSVLWAVVIAGAMGVVYLSVLLILRDTSAHDLTAPLRRARNKRP
jgi:putative peptidoglycan lipid II flippase